MVCNEANLDLLFSFKLKIVISDYSEVAIVSLPFAIVSPCALTGHLIVRTWSESMCGFT